MEPSATQITIEGGIGAGMMTAPIWVRLLQETSLIASTIVAVCGAIIAIHAVWRLWKRSRGS